MPRDRYNPLKHPVSSLALGDWGWTQTANFLLGGLLTVGLAIGLYRSLRTTDHRTFWGPVLVGLWGLGLVGAGSFVTDPISGYPAGTPAAIDSPTWHGSLHDAVSMVGFTAMVAACLVFGRRFAVSGRPWWALYSVASAVAVAVCLVLSSQGFAQAPGLVDIAGLLQRLCVTVGWTWLSALSLSALAESRPEPAARG